MAGANGHWVKGKFVPAGSVAGASPELRAEVAALNAANAADVAKGPRQRSGFIGYGAHGQAQYGTTTRMPVSIQLDADKIADLMKPTRFNFRQRED